MSDERTYVIAEPCAGVKDKACVLECPVDCIYEGERMLYISPDECIYCHLCAPVCPVDAIFPIEELPQAWKFYAEVNRNFFPEKDEAKAWEGHPVASRRG